MVEINAIRFPRSWGKVKTVCFRDERNRPIRWKNVHFADVFLVQPAIFHSPSMEVSPLRNR